jgi:hypothetical protein
VKAETVFWSVVLTLEEALNVAPGPLKNMNEEDGSRRTRMRNGTAIARIIGLRAYRKTRRMEAKK